MSKRIFTLFQSSAPSSPESKSSADNNPSGELGRSFAIKGDAFGMCCSITPPALHDFFSPGAEDSPTIT